MNIGELFGNRIGKFYIDSYIIDPEWILMLKEVFSKTFIVRCECLEYNHKYEYYAYSELFDEARIGEKIPEYKLLINKTVVDASIIYEVKFEKVK